MHAETEPVDEIVRVFADGDTYGSPRFWLAAVKFLTADSVRLVGVTEAISPECKQALLALAHERGWTRIEYQKVMGNGTLETFVRRLPKPVIESVGEDIDR